MWFGARACTPACQVSVMCLAPVKDIYFIQAVHRQLRAVCRSTHTWDTNLHVLLLSSDALLFSSCQLSTVSPQPAAEKWNLLLASVWLLRPGQVATLSIGLGNGQSTANYRPVTFTFLSKARQRLPQRLRSFLFFFERETTNFHSTTRPAQSLVTTNFLWTPSVLEPKKISNLRKRCDSRAVERVHIAHNPLTVRST